VDSQICRKIDKDILRTLPKNPMFGRSSSGPRMLRRILIAYARMNPAVGYCQGMNVLVAVILHHVREEEASFWLFVQLMKRYGLQENFLPGIPGVLSRCARLDDLMVVCLPRLALFLADQGIQSSTMFASSWFIALFGVRVSEAISGRLLDLFLLDGWSVIYTAALNVLFLMQEELLQLDMDGLFSRLEQGPSRFSADQLIANRWEGHISNFETYHTI